MANLLDGGSLTYTTSKGETFSKNEFVLILELLYLTIKCSPLRDSNPRPRAYKAIS